jgi:ABC-type transport system involved in multi-copper enzyme maturation permease subunit
MNMTLHLFKTDLRRSRLLWLIWVILLALQCALIGQSVHPGDRVLQGLFLTISLAVPLFRMIVLIVLIPHLVQEEPLVGTTAFWFTRPIARSAVLQAKALAAAILVALPLLAEVAVLAANGFTLHDISLAVPEICLGELSAIVTIGVVAALTPSFGRFAIAGAVLIVSSIFANLAIYWVRILRDPASLIAADTSLIKARSAAAGILVVVGGGAALVHQYLTRRTVRSIFQAAVVAVGSVVVTGFWPWNFLVPQTAPLPMLDASAFSLVFQGTSTQDLPSLRGAANRKKEIAAQIDVTGLPAGVFCSVAQAHPRLNLPDGNPVKAAEPGGGAFRSWGNRPDADAIEQALAGIPVVNSGTPYNDPRGVLAVDADIYNQYADTPLQLSVDLDFTAWKYVVVAELPLAKGAHYDHGSEHEIITDVLRQGDGVEVVLDLRQAQLLFDQSHSTPNPVMDLGRQGDTVYVLRNKTRNQVVLPKQNVSFDFVDAVQMSGSRLARRTLRLPFGREQYVFAPTLNEAWLADAQLVRLERVPVARFSKPLVVDKFKLGGTNRPAILQPRPEMPAKADALANLRLPDGATKAQVKDYVESVLLAAQRWSSPRPDDPPVEMLRKVGAPNMDVLIEREDQVESGPAKFYLDTVTHELARPEDKAWVLQSLPSHHNLIDVVVKYGWTTEAHDTLVGALKNENERALPRDWIEAVASFKEPSSYPDLLAYLVRGPNRQHTFNTIRKLPGINLRDAVDAGWKRAQHGNAHEVLDGCAMAADFGHADALEALVGILREGGDQSELRHAATLFKRYTEATGNNAGLAAWYDSNRARIVFDEQKKKFIVRPAN